MSDESLDEKIERLEAEQEDLQETVRKMLPNRRQFLKGTATAAGAGALGFATGNASAQASTSDNDGNIGTPSNRVDLFADGVDANVVSTGHTNNIETPEDGTDITDLMGYRKTIVLRPGASYTFSDTPISDHQVIIGMGSVDEGAAPPMLEYTGPTGTGSRAFEWGDPSEPTAGCILRNVKIDCGGAETGFYGRYLTNQTTLDNVWVSNFTGAGFDISKCWYTNFENLTVRDEVGETGIYVHNTDGQVTDVSLWRPQVHGVSGDGIHCEGSAVTMYNPESEQNGDAGIRLDGDDIARYTLIEPYLELNGNAALTTDDGSMSLFVQGGLYTGPPGGVNIDVGSGAVGAFIGGGRFAVEDTGNRPTAHIQSDSQGWYVYNPSIETSTQNADVDIEGRLFGGEDVSATYTSDGSYTDLSTFYGSKPGDVRVHDGSSGHPEGVYYRDSSDDWVLISDNSTTITPS